MSRLLGALSRRLDPRPRQPYMLVPELNVLYIRIPKAASNSVRRWFDDAGHRPQVMHNRPLPLFGSSRYVTVSFVRNPYTRIESAWRDKVVRGGHSLDGLGDGQPSFAEFVDRIADVDPAKVNPHVRPQTLLIGKANPDFLGRVERMQLDLEQLATHLGIRAPNLTRGNSTPSTASRSGVSDLTHAQLADLYAEDFTRFGYSQDVSAG